MLCLIGQEDFDTYLESTLLAERRIGFKYAQRGGEERLQGIIMCDTYTSQTHQINYYSHSVRQLHGDENGAGERTEGMMREGMRRRDARRQRTNTRAAKSTGAHSGGTASTYTRVVAVQMPSAGAALGHRHTYLDLDLNRFSGHADACVGENTDYSLVRKGEVLNPEEQEEKLERVERAAELDDLLDLMGCS